MSTVEADRLSGAERRRWPRARVFLPVQLIDTEGTFGVLSGETMDIGIGGMRARVDGPLSGGVETTVRLGLPTIDHALVCEALVAAGGPVGGGWEYCLAFRNLDPEDIDALQQVVDAT